MVGISLLTLVPSAIGGSETYVRELTAALSRTGRLEYHAFVPRIAPDAAGTMPATVVDAYPARCGTFGRMLAMGKAMGMGGSMRKVIADSGAAALHFPLTAMLPRVRGIPVATTVFDLQHLVFPEFFSTAERTYRRVVYEPSIRRSNLIVTISEHSGRELQEHLGIDPGIVRVIHLGVDHKVFGPADSPREDFLLYPANRWPHKNHDRLLGAFELLRERDPSLRLVLTGGGHNVSVQRGGVEILGHVSQARLIELYQRAAAVVFPSLYEGFGQPVLEAMACGCPVAAAKAGALPEICGDAAVLFDPRSKEAIADGVEQTLAQAVALRERGLVHAAGFTWEATAAAHDAVYRELLSG